MASNNIYVAYVVLDVPYVYIDTDNSYRYEYEPKVYLGTVYADTEEEAKEKALNIFNVARDILHLEKVNN